MPFCIVRDDITRVPADAIVNAANEQLRMGGGVCGAIFRAAGANRLQAACDELGHCPTGSAVATPGFGLAARYVIHTVGPIWDGGTHGERELLESCYRTSLELAESLGCTSIAFPLISAGIYGYPRREALAVAQEAIRSFLETHEMEVTLVLYDAHTMAMADSLRLRVERYIDDVYVGAHARQHPRLAWEQQLHTMVMPAEDVARMDTVDYGELGEPGFCPNCGHPLDEDATFCTVCGYGLPTYGAAGAPMVQEDTCAYAAAPAPAAAAAPAAPAPMPQSAARDTARKTQAAPHVEARRKHARRGLNLSQSLKKLLTHLDAGFSETLLALIDERGLTDAQVYKKANLSRQHFSKIRSNPHYQPTKATVLALAVALELSLDETQMLLRRAGFALNHADCRDVIVEFFIKEGIYDIFDINNALFSFDQPLLR